MILFGYTDNRVFFEAVESLGRSPGALLPRGPGFPVGMLFPQILGI